MIFRKTWRACVPVLVGMLWVLGPSWAQEVEVRAGIVEADKHLAYWVEILSNHSMKLVRKNAARALGSLGRQEAVSALAQGLKDPFHGVRLESARSLGMLGDERAFSPLVDAAERDHDAAVRGAAREAISRIEKYLEYQKKKRKQEEEKVQEQAEDG